MRTTVDIPDPVYLRLKGKAAARKTTVKALLLEGAVKVLDSDVPRTLPRLQLPIIRGTGKTLALDNEAIYDLIDFP